MFPRRIRLLRWVLMLPFLCIYSTTFLIAHVSADNDPIRITTQSDTVTFPKAIDFQMTAHDDSAQMTQATLAIRRNSSYSFSEEHQVDASPQGHTASFHWHDDLTVNDRDFTPPGTILSYYWIITDNAGNSHTGDTQTFEVDDTRFSWQHAKQGLYEVSWYNRDTDFGQAVLKKVGEEVKNISQKLGNGLQKPINMWVYQTKEDFQGSLPPQTHEWVGGIAFPTLNVAEIVIDQTTDDTVIRDMPHELTHLVFHQLTALGLAPIWFDEGLAVYNQEFHEPDMSAQFQIALHHHSLLRLDDISDQFPADADQAYLAYAQSWKLLDYMYSTFGQKKMTTLIADMKTRAHTFDDDVSMALGMDVAHLENRWRISLGQPATLTDGDTAKAPTSPTTQPKVGTDSSTSPLIFLGALLILIPLLSLTSLLLYQRRARVRAQLVQQQAFSINPQGPLYGRPMGQVPYTPYVHPGNYTSPAAYMQPGYAPANEPQTRYPQQYPGYPPYPPGAGGGYGGRQVPQE